MSSTETSELMRDGLFALAEIAGRDGPAHAAELEERCGLDPATLHRTTSLLSELGLIQRAPGNPVAYATVGATTDVPVGQVCELIRARVAESDEGVRAADAGISEPMACMTVGQLARAMEVIEPHLCPCLDVCNAVRGLSADCDPFLPERCGTSA